MSVSRLRKEENDGYFALEEGTGFILLEESTEEIVVSSGGGTRKKPRREQKPETIQDVSDLPPETKSQFAKRMFITQAKEWIAVAEANTASLAAANTARSQLDIT